MPEDAIAVTRKAKPHICYSLDQLPKINKDLYGRIGNLVDEGKAHLSQSLLVPPRDAVALEISQKQLVRIVCLEGPQVADVNLWNIHDTRERFYSSKTRQFHATHLTTFDCLWSGMPYVRPMMVITGDSIKYGFDEDGAGVHDVIGSRCDPYTHAMLTSSLFYNTCHSNLTRAIKPFGLAEGDVHDVFNVFMCTGFTPDTHQYFSKPSPVRPGGYLEMFSEMDQIMAVSSCPQGDVSSPCGDLNAKPKCYPLEIQIYNIPEDELEGWKEFERMDFKGGHGVATDWLYKRSKSFE